MDLNDPKLTDLVFKLLPTAREAARELAHGSQLEDILNNVSKRMATIEAGLSPELEFIAAVNWLGRALTVNRIDQTPLYRYHGVGPESRVPDILSIASINGNSVPLLIEVKKRAKDPMKWSDKYLSGLRVYADTLKLPLLIAWKYHHMWTLTDTHHFEKKVQAHHLGFEKASCENLMSQVFGDLMVVLTQRVALFIDAEVTSEAPLPPLPMLLPAGDHTFKIRDAGFLLDGKRFDIPTELKWLFFCADEHNEVHRTSERTVRILFTPEPETMFSLSDFGRMVMLWNQGENPDWEKVVRERIAVSADEMRKSLELGIKIGVVQYVFDLQPNNKPHFLP